MERRISHRAAVLTSVAGIAIALIAGGACHAGPNAALTKLIEARARASDLQVQFSKAVDASDRAVMADTDEASVAFAQQAQKTIDLVTSDATALAGELHELGYRDEGGLLGEFQQHFAKYREVDRTTLELAVENTNLKAQRLAFGPERQAVDTLRDSLEAFAHEAPAKDRCYVDGLVAKAVLAVREMQVLQGPHIAEADDAAMTRIEAQMTAQETAASEAIHALSGPGEAATPPATLAAALAAFEQFKNVSRQIVAFSRRNSNVRSLSLSLAQKPDLVAACDGSLLALTNALAKQTFAGTR